MSDTTSYNFPSSYYTSGGNYYRDYSTGETTVSTLYNPGAFFTAFGSKSAVATKLNYAKTGLGISQGSTTYTDTYNPSTGLPQGGSEFRAIFTHSIDIGREPYAEYSHVATPLPLYDVCIRNTDSTTYIDSAEYESSSWTTTTDTLNGRVIVGTTGNTHSIIISDDSVEVNSDLVPKTNSTFNIGTLSNKWKDLYVGTIHADTYDGIPSSGSSGLSVSDLYGSSEGGLYFFKLYINNNSMSSITVPRGTSLTDPNYFDSSYLYIQSYEERVDDTSESSGTGSFSGTYYTLLSFSISGGGSGNVYVPCVRVL